MSRRAAAALLFLSTAAFFCYGGPGIARLGFYHDDWIFLSSLRFAPPGFMTGMDALQALNASLWFRPLGLPLYSLLYLAFGLNPLGWQACLLLTNALAAFAVGRIMVRFGIAERPALLGALLFLCWPSKDAVMFWPFVIINSASLFAMLAAYLSHLDYVESGRRRSLVLSAAGVIASLALYDQCVFFFPLWLVTPGLSRGLTPRAKGGAAAAAAATAVFLAFKLGFVTHVMHIPFNKAFMFTPSHFLMTFLRGAEANFGPRLVLFSLRALRAAFAASPVIVIAAAALAWATPGSTAEERPPRDGAAALALLGAGVFFLGYLPVSVSDYWPTPINHQNRLNEVPVAGLIFALTACGSLAMRPRGFERAAAALASALLAVHVGLAGIWSESYRRQLAVRGLILEHRSRWPAETVLLVALPERYVEGKAPVFDAHYDITGAARVWTGDATRRADVVSPRMEFAPDGAATSYGKLPYSSLLRLDVGRGLLTAAEYRDFR